MVRKGKKALFAIVEGDSDSHFFFDELQKKCRDEHILIKAYDGDIFTDYSKMDIPIRDRIRAFFVERMGELRVSDFLGILHLTDTDGAFVSDDKVIVDLNQQEKIIYSVNGIFVNSAEQQEKMQRRNQQKKSQTAAARFISNITYNKIEIPYRLFYLSQHLEHVVFDELNVPGNEKIKKIIKFIKEQAAPNSIESLLNNHFPQLPVLTESKHKESWDFIFQGDNSLQRYTNAELMYGYLEELLKIKEEKVKKSDSPTVNSE